MLKNIVGSEWKEHVYHELVFDDGHNNGFSFPCNKEGRPMLNPDSKKNYDFCLAHPEKFIRSGKVVTHNQRYKENAHGVCGCGEDVELYDKYMGACQCRKCGQWYNLFGQELNPPECWGETDYDY